MVIYHPLSSNDSNSVTIITYLSEFSDSSNISVELAVATEQFCANILKIMNEKIN